MVTIHTASRLLQNIVCYLQLVVRAPSKYAQKDEEEDGANNNKEESLAADKLLTPLSDQS
jgi:hypothetical protein